MLVVGLTGGIASGKSTVSKQLSQRHHLTIIDADILAREVVAPGTSGLKSIVSSFGPSILTEAGDLDRQKLGEIIFNDEKKRHVLNGIIHPAVRRAMLWGVVKAWMRGEWAVIVDVPLLIETKLYRYCGKVAVVYVNEACQLARLKARPPLNPSDPPLSTSAAQSRIAAQLPLTSKLSYADTVLDNSGSLQDLFTQVDQAVKKWKDECWGWTGVCRWLPPVGLWVGFWSVIWRAVRRRRRMGKRRGRGENAKDGAKGESYEMKDRTR